MAGIPAPRSRLEGNVSPIIFAPVAVQMRPAATSPRSRMAVPPRRRATGSPDRRTLAISSIRLSGAWLGALGVLGGQGPVEDSDQDASAGNTRVATHPGGP